MSMLSDKNKNALGGLALAQTASDFSIIQDPDCAGVLCQAGISSHILAWLASLDPACLPKARVILRPDGWVLYYPWTVALDPQSTDPSKIV